MEEDGPTIPVRMNKRITEKSLKNMNGDFLLGLRDMRRSENGNYVRSHNQAASDTERKTINMYFKDQRWQLAKIKRGQVQFYNRLLKVHRHKRKCQREEYKRRQEEIRRDMQNIRLRRLIKRVVEKFRQNAKRKKAERARKRFAIAGGLRNASGLGGAAQHGVAGIRGQGTDSITRMIKLAAKRESLEKEGVLPKQPSINQNKADVSQSETERKDVLSLPENQKKEASAQSRSQVSSQTIPKKDDNLDRKLTSSITVADGDQAERSQDSNTKNTAAIPEVREQKNNNSLPSSDSVSRLTTENLAVHEQLLQEEDIESSQYPKRIPKKAQVLEVSKGYRPISKTLIAYDETDVRHDESECQVQSISHKHAPRKDLASLRVPRRARIKPPPTSFLRKIDEVDAVQKVNTAVEEYNGDDGEREDEIHGHHSVPLSRIIRMERREAEKRRLELLNQELVPHYKRTPSGRLRVQMVPFVRNSFDPPSNKIRYEQDKLKKEEKMNMARQRVRIRNFVQHCPVAEPEVTHVFRKRDNSDPKTTDVSNDKPVSLTTLMFSVYHQEKPPEGVDPNSVDALKKCRYIRYYDLIKNKKDKEQFKRKQQSSWGNSSMSEQERRRQLLLYRQRATVYR